MPAEREAAVLGQSRRSRSVSTVCRSHAADLHPTPAPPHNNIYRYIAPAQSDRQADAPVTTSKVKKINVRIALYGLETYHTATERHLPYGITQCYLPPYTGERAPP